MPSLKADDCPVDTSAIFDAEDTLDIDERLEQKKLEYEHVKEVLDTLNSLVACDAAVSTTEEETLITFTGFCWRCHSTEHNTYKCPNAKDDKYNGNFEKNHMRYLELKAIEMKKEKKCCRCMTKKKLPEFFHCDWCIDEGECVCKDCRKLEVKVCCRCTTKKKRPEFFQSDWNKDESERVCKDCRKLVVKYCYTCWTPKKKHSFKTEQWYCNEESDRVCNVCLKYKGRIGNVWGKKKTSKYVSLSKKAKVQHKRKQ